MIQGKASLLSNLQKLKYSIIHIIKYKRNSECVTSSAISFAYPPCCAYNCFVEIGETLKCHNFLILLPISMKFSASCLFNFTLFIKINLILVWTWPLNFNSRESMLRELRAAILLDGGTDCRWSFGGRKHEADGRKLDSKLTELNHSRRQVRGVFAERKNASDLMTHCPWLYTRTRSLAQARIWSGGSQVPNKYTPWKSIDNSPSFVLILTL